MKPMRMLVALSLSFLLGCTNALHVSSADGTVYHHRTIAVSCSGDDHLSIRQKLEELLASKGFSVIPERSARVKAKMRKGGNTLSGRDTGRIPPDSSQGSDSIYILQFSYEYSSAVSYGDYMFKAFSASVLDLANGNVVASSDFSQSIFSTRSASSVLEEFVNRLADSI